VESHLRTVRSENAGFGSLDRTDQVEQWRRHITEADIVRAGDQDRAVIDRVGRFWHEMERLVLG
jgi:hypothetical protein